MLDEATYDAAVAQLFKRITKAVDAADPDALEADTTGDMITITAVRSGTRVVVNTQRAVKQIWVAGKGMGVHFTLTDGRWLDDKGKGLEVAAWVDECVESAAGVRLGLGA